MTGGHQLSQTRLLAVNNWDELGITQVQLGPGQCLTQFIKICNDNIAIANVTYGKNVGPMSLGWPIWRVRDYLNVAFVVFGNP